MNARVIYDSEGRETNRSEMPEELKARLNEPEAVNLGGQERPNFPHPQVNLQPARQPVPGELPFVQLVADEEQDSGGDWKWLNRPEHVWRWDYYGRGLGFAILESPVRIEIQGKRPKVFPDFNRFGAAYLASAHFVEIVTRFAPQAIETCPVNLRFIDGEVLEGYTLFDVRKLVPAYDYKNCEIIVKRIDGKLTFRGLSKRNRNFKPDIDRSLQIFRDEYEREDMFVSRELGRALKAAKLKGVWFHPITGLEWPIP